jgi:hypothetical protein
MNDASAARKAEPTQGRRQRSSRIVGAIALVVGVLAPSCGVPVPAGPAEPTASRSPTAEISASDRPRTPSAGSPPTTSPAESRALQRRTPSACPRAEGEHPSTKVPDRLSLVGKRGNAWAFAPLDRRESVTVEGRVSSSPAWSTSKVLVVAAYLDTAVDGQPKQVSAANRRLITAALTRSDADAVTAVRNQIPGRPGLAMTAVLRSIGDTTTVAPDSYQGTMQWSLREQVRFTAAMAAGRVVSRAASDYLLETMHPIPAHAWGLGTIGATAFKGGWLRQTTPTRQLGIVDGYAVAISTEVGDAVRQTDGDAAHVEQMNRLARLLRQRLTWEQTCR